MKTTKTLLLHIINSVFCCANENTFTFFHRLLCMSFTVSTSPYLYWWVTYMAHSEDPLSTVLFLPPVPITLYYSLLKVSYEPTPKHCLSLCTAYSLHCMVHRQREHPSRWTSNPVLKQVSKSGCHCCHWILCLTI